MTEAEEIEYLQELERVTEEYFNIIGFDIDMSEMSTYELEQFFLHLTAPQQTGLAVHVAKELTGTVPDPDILDFAAAAFIPWTIGGFPIVGPAKVLKTPAKLVGRGLRWIGRALNLIDDSGDVARVVTEVGAPTIRASGFGRVEDVAQLGEDIAAGRRAGSISGVMGRTTAGPGYTSWLGRGGRIPRVDEDVLRGAAQVVGIGAAGAATAGFIEQSAAREKEAEPWRGFAPDSEEDEEEKETRQKNLEFQQAKQALAEETDIVSVGSIIGPDPQGVMKQIYFEGLSETAVFDKLTNYIAGSGVNVLAESGISLGAALEQQEAAAGMGGSLGQMHIYSLLDEPGRDAVRKYLKANWQRIDTLKNDPRVAAIPQREAGRISGPVLSQTATTDAVIEEFLVGMSNNADFLLLTPEDPSGTGDAIGFITSFDGTVHGNVVSFNDMFSGGRIGHMNLLPMLMRARPEQITMWQQELYAWGYLENPPEVWGQLTPDAQGNIHTLDAAHKWQVAVFNEGTKMVRDAQRASPSTPVPLLSELIAADGTPRADRVLDRAIAAQMSGESTRATDARTMRDRVVVQAQDRVGRYLEATGRYLPEGSQLQIQSELDQVLSGLSYEDQESAFGQGGSQYERALAENILRRLSEANSGTSNWKDVLTFGTTNRDSSFFDYAARVGAVSERERVLLQAGVMNRGTYRDHWRDRHEELKEAEADVAVAALLKFISQGMTSDFSTVTSADIARGINVYMHTVGIQQGLANPIGRDELAFLAQGALTDARNMRFQQDNQMLTDVATGGVDRMGLRGGVSGYQFKELVNELDSIQGVRRLGVANV